MLIGFPPKVKKKIEWLQPGKITGFYALIHKDVKETWYGWRPHMLTMYSHKAHLVHVSCPVDPQHILRCILPCKQ